MNPLFRQSPTNPLFSGLSEGYGMTGTPELDADAARAAPSVASSIFSPGSMRRAITNSGAMDVVQKGLETAAYFAGPHLSNRVAPLGTVAGFATENMFGNKDARAASEDYQRGDYGSMARNVGLSMATGLLDAPSLGMGGRLARPMLKGLGLLAHQQPAPDSIRGPGVQPSEATPAVTLAATPEDQPTNFWDAFLRR